MKQTLSSQVQVDFPINANRLWQVLTQSEFTQVYMFNCIVKSDWTIGASITWQGNYQGYQAFQKGEILAITPHQLIKYSTFDPNTGLNDVAENYIHVTYLIEEGDDSTKLTIINETFDGSKERMEHVEQGWVLVVTQMEKLVKDLMVE